MMLMVTKFDEFKLSFEVFLLIQHISNVVETDFGPLKTRVADNEL